MTRRTTFKHVAAGLLQSFLSRNNDVGGFWALGVLYGEASAPGHAIELNLLEGGAVPSTPGAAQVACDYAAFLQAALIAKGIVPDELAEARVSVQFDTELQNCPVNVVCQGDPFICTVTLRSVQGKEALMRAAGRCVRKGPGRFTRRAGDPGA